jgi:hypothetical protein
VSTEFFLVSEDEAIWVAQNGLGGFSFYSGEPACMRALSAFLERNQGKKLEFLPAHKVDDAIDAGRLKEIEWQNEVADDTK